ncbi:MAG: adenosylmethionine--8-amino-7-oxononanoate transaminase [Kordiimonas sp.]|nr:adenosylmethionine--8-amino-7-oxononanoate transaminase [Kordiimonas sp.]
MSDSSENLPDWYREGYDHVWLPYTQMQTAAKALPVKETRGQTLTLADGRELVDGIASWWTACHGYNDPRMQKKIVQQLSQMSHVMFGGLVHEPALRLAKRLADLLPGDLDHVFFSESGSVAVEIALKMAVQYWTNQGIKGHNRFVSFRAGYHGDTTATMAVGDTDDGMHQAFGDYLEDQYLVDLPVTTEQAAALDQLLAEKKNEIAAVLIEPLIQGAGGMKFHGLDVLQRVARICSAHDVLLIADEIFTGFGRTGTMFACEQADIVPDIICLGKALSGGMAPMAATVAGKKVYDAFLSEDADKAFMHGPTYMANPLACAAANASLDLFAEEPRLEQVRRIEQHLGQSFSHFRHYPNVVDVRVKGAVAVIEMTALPDRQKMQECFTREGVWLRPFGNVIYLTPSFTIAPDELAKLTQAIDTMLTESMTGSAE